MDWLIIIFIVYGIVSKLMGGSEKNGRSRTGQRQQPRQGDVPKPRQAPEPWTNQYPKQTKRPKFDPFDPFDPFSTEDQEGKDAWPTFPSKQEKEIRAKETVMQSKSNTVLLEKNTYISEKAETKNEEDKKTATTIEKNNVQINPSSQALVQGIIWSEILGPPRSRNPHRSVHYRR